MFSPVNIIMSYKTIGKTNSHNLITARTSTRVALGTLSISININNTIWSIYSLIRFGKAFYKVKLC